MTHHPQDHAVPAVMRQRLDVGARIIASECSRPIMRGLFVALLIEIAIVLVVLAYFHFTAASEPTARLPATTAHEAGGVVTGGHSE